MKSTPTAFGFTSPTVRGALIANEVFDLGKKRGWLGNANTCIKNQLIPITYGAVTPIRDEYAFQARNTYSLQDIVLLMSQNHFDIDFTKLDTDQYTAIKDREGNEYTIRVVSSELYKSGFISDSLFRDILGASNEACAPSNLPLAARANRGMLVQYPFRMIYETIRRLINSIDDHGFTRDSYKKALEDDIDDLKNYYGVHNFKKNH